MPGGFGEVRKSEEVVEKDVKKLYDNGQEAGVLVLACEGRSEKSDGWVFVWGIEREGK